MTPTEVELDTLLLIETSSTTVATDVASILTVGVEEIVETPSVVTVVVDMGIAIAVAATEIRTVNTESQTALYFLQVSNFARGMSIPEQQPRAIRTSTKPNTSFAETSPTIIQNRGAIERSSVTYELFG